MTDRRLTATAAIVVAGVLIASLIAPTAGTAQTTATERDTVTVTAVGKVEGRPDVAVVHLGVRAVAATADGAMDRLARRQNAVIDALEQGVGLSDEQVRTGNITVGRNCRYDHRLERSICEGFVARTSVRAETNDLQQVGTIIDAALRAGASSLHGVSFERTENDQALREALAQAMDLAHAKAETLARSAGRTLGRVMVIEEGGARRPVFGEEGAVMGLSARAADLDIDPPDEITRVEIVVTYALD